MVEQLEYKFGFEKLDVWQSAVELSKLVYAATSKFPQNEIYGLTSQLRRAVISVSSNIAEGSCKSSLKDQARFSEIAFGSLMEILNQLIIARDINYVSEGDYYSCRKQIELISRQLNAFKNSQLRRVKDVQKTK